MIDNSSIEQVNTENVSEKEEDSQQQSSFNEEAIKKLIQSEVDKVRGKYSSELKKKDEELKKIRAEHLTKEEIAKAELEEKLKELEEQRTAFNLEKNKNFAKDLLAKSKLCSDGEKTLKLVDLVMGNTEEEISSKVKYVSEVIDEIVAARVEEKFKTSGRQVIKTNGDASLTNNPWSKESFNLTEQMGIELNNPELAKKLKTQANIIP